MTELSALKVKRGHIKAKVTRFSNYFDSIDLNNLDDTIILQLKCRLSKFEPIWDEFNDIQCQIMLLDSSQSDDEEQDLFESNYFNLIAKIQEVINKYNSRQSESFSVNNTVNSPNIKLPTIKLPVFKGLFVQWQEFRDAFNAMVHNNRSISNTEKFYYLKSSLSDEALRVINSIEISDSNYNIAWQLLNERYENKGLIVFSHVQAIFEAPCVNKESHAELRRLFDDVTKHLRALQSLGMPTEHWDALIIYLFSKKLDPVTRREWETFNIQGELPTMNDMNKFLKHKCELLEKLNYNVQEKSNKFKIKIQSNVTTSNNNVKCYFCKEMHTIYNCESFLKLSVNLRVQEAKNKRLCLNCLRPGHSSPFCKASGCKRCNKRHNSLLHLQFNNNAEQNSTDCDNADEGKKEICNEKSESSQAVTLHNTSVNSSQALLSTAVVQVCDSQGKFHNARVLLDCASQSHFITENFCEKLKLHKSKVDFSIVGVGEAITSVKSCTIINLFSRFNNFSANISCLIIPKITEQLPSASFNNLNLNVPPNIHLADPEFSKSGPIDILIGVNLFWELLSVGRINLGKDLPVLQKTQLGWIIAGNLNICHPNKILATYLSVNSGNNIDEQLTRFWKLEECHVANNGWSKSEQFCEQHFSETHQRIDEGRFIVKIPLRSNVNKLGATREQALERFYSIERKLLKNLQLKDDYVSFMREYITLGHMTAISENDPEDKINYYLPHHAVVKESSITSKVRIVFDGSMKSDSGLSFNEVQYTGPTIQNGLLSLILRFRQYQFVISADISKMYRQILVCKEQRCLQRIFWRESPQEKLQCYELNTVTYGMSSSPYLAIRCLYQLALDNELSNPVASNVIKNDFYVDDLLTGSNSITELITIQKNVSTILSGAGFELRKWLSNQPNLSSQFHVNRDIESSILQLGDDQSNKTLGVLWNSKLDTIQYSIRCFDFNHTVTKRSILSITSQIFDPLGLLGPVVIIAKLIIQKLWQAKLSWDESVPQNIHASWFKFRKNLVVLNELKIPRWILAEHTTLIEIHGFSDASEAAYGACVYVRCKTNDNSISVTLLSAKSRIAPIKNVSLPRLELCGAQLLAQLVHKIRNALNIQFDNYYYWCDSTITLSWIKSPPNKWKTFVANRVSNIQELTNENDWHHISADLLSRGLDAAELIDSELWWKGPPWLAKDEQSWNLPILDNTLTNDEIPEQRSIAMTAINNTNDLDIFSRYSSVLKLQRVIAYCYRFISNLKSKEKRPLGPLTISELQLSLMSLVKISQKESFAQDYNNLINKKSISKTSNLASLNPFMDDNNIIRVGGRIQKGNYEYNKKHPIILHPKHHLTKLILIQEHERLFHCGPQQLLSSIREIFWPLTGRNIARNIVRKCIKCFRVNPTSESYIMGNLPSARVNQYSPFYNTGIDYAGPFLLKDRKSRGAKLIKTYICLFVCLSTKVMHLELVTDLTTDAFLCSLKRFISRRGKPSKIYSDNGTNFVGANTRLQEMANFLELNSNEIVNSMSKNNIEWHFIPPRAPNFGGLWEAGVKSVKYYLKRVIGNASLTYEEFCTVLYQIEAILNSRPLCPLTSSPLDYNPLTPAHLLIGRSLTAIPEPSVLHISESRLNKYQRLQQLTQHFWQRWHKEYVGELQSRCKWKFNSSNILKIDSLVVVKEDNQPPLKWSLGRIINLHPGEDGVIRVVSIRLPNSSVIKRAVSKVCVLPIDDNCAHPINDNHKPNID